MSMVRWRVVFRLSSISQTAMRETGSRPVVGSSRKKMLRIVHQAAGDLQAPPHAAGERLGLRIAPLRQVHGLQHIGDVLFAHPARHAVELGVDLQIFFDGQVLVAGQGLGNDADHAAHLVGIFGHVVAADDRLAGGDRNQRGHHADERAFAGAVGAEQAEDLAFGTQKLTPLTASKSP